MTITPSLAGLHESNELYCFFGESPITLSNAVAKRSHPCDGACPLGMSVGGDNRLIVPMDSSG